MIPDFYYRYVLSERGFTWSPLSPHQLHWTWDVQGDKHPRMFVQVLKSQGERTCAYCGVGLDRINRSLDHVHPVALGGSKRLDNIVRACKRCNGEKGDRSLLAFLLDAAMRATPIKVASLRRQAKTTQWKDLPGWAFLQGRQATR
jgi:5-methylcytosine-specific restriction endonuclease McrA